MTLPTTYLVTRHLVYCYPLREPWADISPDINISPKNVNHRWQLKITAIRMIRCLAGKRYTMHTMVTSKRGTVDHDCIVFKSNDPSDGLPQEANREAIETVKRICGINVEPMWMRCIE